MGSPGRPERSQKGRQNRRKMGDPFWERPRHQNGANMEPEWFQNVARMEPIGCKNDEILIDFFNSFY